jgi:hypothetical protein
MESERRLRLLQCEEGDSNPHGVNRQLLRLVRLPISPSSRDAIRKISGRYAIPHTGRLFAVTATLPV